MIYQVVIKSSHNHPVFLGKQVDKSQFLTANQDNYSNKIHTTFSEIYPYLQYIIY